MHLQVQIDAQQKLPVNRCTSMDAPRTGLHAPLDGTRISPASGGSVRLAEKGWPWRDSSVASTPPRFPRFDPP
jgi:hypothetical protein